ncbi:MAG: transglycosylase SLT domain-containing protein [Acetobacteraceae bacterium]
MATDAFANQSLCPLRSALMARARFSFLAVFAAGLLASAAPTHAAPSATGEASPPDQCLTAVAAAERKYGIPTGLLAVMAKVESGRAQPGTGMLQPWPWTVDADGRGAYLPTRADAVAWARQALESGTVTYVDVGCMQVNLQMHPNAFVSLEQAFDPAANADYGGRFLRRLYDGVAMGNWFTAVGFYHSQTPILAANYRSMVVAVAAGLPPPRMAAGHLSTVRIDLVGGGALRINTKRQPARVQRVRSSCQIAAVLGPYLPRRVAGCGAAGRAVAASPGSERKAATDALTPVATPASPAAPPPG